MTSLLFSSSLYMCLYLKLTLCMSMTFCPCLLMHVALYLAAGGKTIITNTYIIGVKFLPYWHMYLTIVMNPEMKLGFRYFIYSFLKYFFSFTDSILICYDSNRLEILSSLSKRQKRKDEYCLCLHVFGRKL